MRKTILALATTLMVAACGPGSGAPELPPPAPLAPDALPWRAGEIVELDAASVAEDAVRVADLEAILTEAGFAGATQRVFANARGARQQHSLARVLAFADASGAQAYLDWLREHVDEVIGTAEFLEPPDPLGFAFLALSDTDCCPKATEVYLAAWRRGSTVLTLEVGGDGLNEALVASLAEDLDRAVTS